MSHYEKNQRRFEELVASCDEMIRAGRINEVTSLVSSLNFSRVPRAFRQSLAKIARRCGAIEDGLALLHPVIRQERPLEVPATPGERCEYAVLLSRNGLIPEALELLRGVDPVKSPEALLYQGFCHVSSWNYAAAREHFERFLESRADDYSKLIARVNLAACYVVIGFGPATLEFITQTFETAQRANATRLAANSLELRAQYHLSAGDLEKAGADLDCAQEIFGKAQSYDQLLIEKWRALIEATKMKSAAPLRRFRETAASRRFWEFVRDADLLALKFEFDQSSLDHLYFGSPNDAYRERIRQQIAAEPSASFVWGEVAAPRFKFDDGSLIHRLIAALARDLYAPRRMGPLFSELYPGQSFDVHSSNLRLRQLMKRARQWFESNSIPLTIRFENGGYRLTRTSPVGVELALSDVAASPEDYRLKILRQGFQRPFTREEAGELLALSKTSLHRLFETLIVEGYLERTGVGKATKYRFASAESKKAA